MRKHKLSKEMIQLCYELLKEGHYNEDVAIAIGITERSFYTYIEIGNKIEEKLTELDFNTDELQDLEISYKKSGTQEYVTEYEFLCFQFSQIVKRANVEAKMEALRNIRRAGKKSWQAEAWFLERKFRKQFGRVTMLEDAKDNDSKGGLLQKLISGVDAIAQDDEADDTEE